MWGERGRIMVLYIKGTKRNLPPFSFYQIIINQFCWCEMGFALFFISEICSLFFEYSPSQEHHVTAPPRSEAETWLPRSHPACLRRPGWGDTACGALSERQKWPQLSFTQHGSNLQSFVYMLKVESKMNAFTLEKTYQVVSGCTNMDRFCHHFLREGKWFIRTPLSYGTF